MEDADIFLEIKTTKEQILTIFEKIKEFGVCDKDIFAGIYKNRIDFKEEIF